MRVINVALFVAMFLFISHLQGGLKAYLDPVPEVWRSSC